MYHFIWLYIQNSSYSSEYIKKYLVNNIMIAKYLVNNIVIAKYLVYGNEKVNALPSCSLRIQ